MVLKTGLSIPAYNFVYGKVNSNISYLNSREKRVEIELSFEELYDLFNDKLDEQGVEIFLLDSEKPRLVTKISKVGIYATDSY